MTEEQTIPAPPRWTSYREIERLYGMSRWTVLRLARAEAIHTAKVGTKTLVECKSVESYLNSGGGDIPRDS